MAKVTIVIDKKSSAIDILAQGVKKYNPHHDISVVAVHPKRPSIAQIEEFKESVVGSDVVDFQYWKTAMLLREEYPEYLEGRKIILQHHNPYSIKEDNWDWADIVVTNNKAIQQELFDTKQRPSTLIYNTVDVTTFEYLEKYKWNNTVGMIAGRIESNKGIRQVAELCQRLHLKFILVGRISNQSYFDSFSKLPCLDFRKNVSDKEKKKAIHEMNLLVVNSVDGFESGPIPPIEAMASGIPVASRLVGTMKDILKHKDNSLVFDTSDQLKEILLAAETDKMNKIRGNGWQLVKKFDDRRRARKYSSMYNSLANDHQRLVSVVIPTADRVKNIINIVVALQAQIYKHIEIVIADDGTVKIPQKIIKKLRENSSYPIKYVKVDGYGYQLAKARNLGVAEAEGEYIMFVDDRLQPKSTAIQNFVDSISYEKEWLFGNKGSGKKSFIENFSFIRRKAFIEAGMFNTLMSRYGGISQEIRDRFRRQNFQLRYIRSAKCDPISGTHMSKQRREDIIEMKYLLHKLYED